MGDFPVAACIAGANACPPEDCGGPWGYAALLEVLADPAHPEHAERLEWLGGGFDPAHFDRDAVNAAINPVLRKALKPK